MEEQRYKILILATGGTIAGEKDATGTIVINPNNNVIEGLVQRVKGAWNTSGTSSEKVSIDIKHIAYKDSSNMSQKDREEIGAETFKELQKYDAIVVTHGTDTIADTASFLGVALKTDRSVILTGSMKIASEHDTDAVKNLADSITFAIDARDNGKSGVFVVFHGSVFEGKWTYKIRPGDLNGIKSYFGPIAEVDNGIVKTSVGYYAETAQNQVQPKSQKSPTEPSQERKLSFDTGYSNKVALIRVQSYTSPNDVLSASKGKDVVVIQGLGDFNVPQVLLPAVKKAMEDGTMVFVTGPTNETHGQIGSYAVGMEALKAGIIPAPGPLPFVMQNASFAVGGGGRSREEVLERFINNYPEQLAKELKSYLSHPSTTDPRSTNLGIFLHETERRRAILDAFAYRVRGFKERISRPGSSQTGASQKNPEPENRQKSRVA